MNSRRVAKSWRGELTQDGAGVTLKRIFGYYEAVEMDPFLLLDFFGSDDPTEYIAGFPFHPHRGIETITYMLKGMVKHEDSLGNKGVIGPGDVQWMTAGSGIIHEEMPQQSEGRLAGFQLWANLPSSRKMMNPRYRDIASNDIAELTTDNGAKVKIIAGDIDGVKGPVQDVVTNPQYLDVEIPESSKFSHQIEEGHTVFAYVFRGEGVFDGKNSDPVKEGTLALFSDGTSINISTNEETIRFLLVSGKPLREPIAWRGPIVMNTDEELRQAFAEYRKGTFLKR